MKLIFSNDWLRSQIEKDPGLECDAGFPLMSAEPLRKFVDIALQSRGTAAIEGPANCQGSQS